MPTDRPHLVLVNPSAGGGRARELLPRLEGALRDHAIDHRLVMTTSLDHGVQEARAAARNGEIPVVMSGDGLIGQIGGALAGTGVPMGVIPGGRGNDLARVLGIPMDASEAVALIARGTTRQIDVGEVNGHRFVGIASCGFDSDANRLANQARLVRGNLVYLYAALRALAAWKPARFELILDGEREVFTGYSAGACNNKAYGGGMYAAPDAELDDGLFDVAWVEELPKRRFLFTLLPRLFNGTYVALSEVVVRRARGVEIRADRPFAVYADGDHVTDLPATVRLLPRALTVIAPPGALVGPRGT
jgi:YegS/Rv2252/BmrU family lipid kinase